MNTANSPEVTAATPGTHGAGIEDVDGSDGASSAAGQASLDAPGRIPTVLAVDDSKSMRLILEATLVGAGYRVTLAADGREALQHAVAAAQTPGGGFDLVLTDHNMPNLTGLDLIAALRDLAPYADTPILMLTTEDSDAFKVSAREAGANGWLLKPLDPQVLADVLESVRGALAP